MREEKPMFQGEVLSIEKSRETRKDDQGETWTNCIITVKLTGLPNGVKEKDIHKEWIGNTIELRRWCCYDWHYKTPVRTTIDDEEFKNRVRK